MDISKKLLFFLCMIFIGNAIAMEKNGGYGAYDEYYKNKYGFIESQLKPKEKIIGLKDLTFTDFLAKKDSQSIVYNTLCKDRNNMPPFLSIVKFATASEDNPIEITHVDYIIDTKPFEEQAIKEKMEEIGNVNLETARYLDEERTKLKQNFTAQEQRINNLEQMLKTKNKLLTQQVDAINKREEALQNDIKKTFWNRNPKYAFGMGFLTCGLLGLTAYYGHSKIDAFVGYVSSFWRRN